MVFLGRSDICGCHSPIIQVCQIFNVRQNITVCTLAKHECQDSHLTPGVLLYDEWEIFMMKPVVGFKILGVEVNICILTFCSHVRTL